LHLSSILCIPDAVSCELAPFASIKPISPLASTVFPLLCEGVMMYLAYGSEPNRRATYELRQSRYDALGETVAAEARKLSAEQGNRCRFLDVGVFDGVSRRYTEIRPGSDNIDYEAVDIFPYGHEFVYKYQDWKLHNINLLDGMKSLASNTYDVVVCEQVLEHLTDVQPAIEDMVRVLKPNGLLIVGVPIFPEGLHLVRKHVVPITDRLFQVKKIRGHVQAWSLRTFLQEFRIVPNLDIQQKRGFRIISGGLLRPLEFTRQWWQINRRIGTLVPGLCTEVQLVCRKRREAEQRSFAQAA
jgi:SAM-dependent methyltransferase